MDRDDRAVLGATIDWVVLYWYDPLQIVRNFLLLQILIPLRNFYQWFPWLAIALLFALLGLRLGGWHLGLLSFLLIAFPALTGFWKPTSDRYYIR